MFFSLGQITSGNASELDISFQKSKSLIDKSSDASSVRNIAGNRFDLKMIAAGVIALIFSMVI